MIRIRNLEGTRSVELKSQTQLDVVRDVINAGVSKKRFNSECLKRLALAYVSPDFEGPGSRAEFENVSQALAVLSEIEYSSDGFVKRYPDQDRYDAAVSFLTKFCAPKKKR